MTRNENTEIILQYNYADVLKWIKQDAANVLNLTAHEITEDMIQITPDSIKELDIKVTHIKIIGKAL